MTEQNTIGEISAVEPATPQTVETPVPTPGPKDRRKLRAALRWTAAALVFAVVGAGTAYGITRSERTDLPGLSTLPDGRWTYPAQARPELPAGAPVPAGSDNPDGTHYADLHGLLLTAPEGAKPDEGLKADKDGVVTPDAFLEEYPAESRPRLKESFEWEGVRKIVGRGWTMPDGTRSRVYLLRFHSSDFVGAFGGCALGTSLNGAAALSLDPVWVKAKTKERSDLGTIGVGATGTGIGSGRAGGPEANVYEETKPFGDEQTRLGCLQAGDVQAVIIQTRKGGAAVVPFHQTLILQAQLLG
ncbi:hypothetical protein [Streptomyces sp. NPDC096339]|uniref:hypothetical protein n=1 Tax=Streptomyces sp. NPDC096339 TaxID=3366086 RepID=UPI003830DBF0